MTLQQAADAEQAMRRFKKKLAPHHIQPGHVVPCGTFGSTGVTLRRMPPAIKSQLKVIENHAH